MKLRSVIAGGVLSLALVGCGDDGPDAAPSSPVTSSSSPSQEPSPTFDPKKETAKEFIRRWIRLDAKAQTTGDVNSYLAITSDQCRSCKQFVDRISEIYTQGGWIKTGGGEAISITHDAKAQWSVVIESGPTRYVDTEGGEVQTFPGGRAEFVVYIARDSKRHWVLTSYAEKSG